MSLFFVFILVFRSFAAAAGCLPALALLLALPPPLLSVSTSVVVFTVSSPPSSLLGGLTGDGGGRGGFRPPPSSLLPWARFGVLGEASLTQSRALSTSIPGGSETVWNAFTFRFCTAGPSRLASLEVAVLLANVGGILSPPPAPPHPLARLPGVIYSTGFQQGFHKVFHYY